ncbi:MAG: hypothetical protein AAF710_06080 [Planctomycetota bacterium]
MNTPEWFNLSEDITTSVLQRVSQTIQDSDLPVCIRSVPLLSFWFFLDSIRLANQANRDGMHANALSLTRQCFEALIVIDLSICGHNEAEAIISRWDEDRINPGGLRKFLDENVWQAYGHGLWDETYAVFMKEFAKALQPYAHYCSKLAQWQVRQIPGSLESKPGGGFTALLEMRPRAYDPQKATRITLFHSILTYCLGRIWIANNKVDFEFKEQVKRLGAALGKSEYLDGHKTDWGQQFWAMLWSSRGDTVLE